MINLLKKLFRRSSAPKEDSLNQVSKFSVNEPERTRNYVKEVQRSSEGDFSITVTSVTEMATSRQKRFLLELNNFKEGLTKYEAKDRITWALRPVDYALKMTFTNCEILSKEYYRVLQIGLANSEIIKDLPKYGPSSYAKDLDQVEYNRRLTKEERHKITDLSLDLLPFEVFKKLISNGVKKYKRQVEEEITSGWSQPLASGESS